MTEILLPKVCSLHKVECQFFCIEERCVDKVICGQCLESADHHYLHKHQKLESVNLKSNEQYLNQRIDLEARAQDCIALVLETIEFLNHRILELQNQLMKLISNQFEVDFDFDKLMFSSLEQQIRNNNPNQAEVDEKQTQEPKISLAEMFDGISKAVQAGLDQISQKLTPLLETSQSDQFVPKQYPMGLAGRRIFRDKNSVVRLRAPSRRINYIAQHSDGTGKILPLDQKRYVFQGLYQIFIISLEENRILCETRDNLGKFSTDSLAIIDSDRIAVGSSNRNVYILKISDSQIEVVNTIEFQAPITYLELHQNQLFIIGRMLCTLYITKTGEQNQVQNYSSISKRIDILDKNTIATRPLNKHILLWNLNKKYRLAPIQFRQMPITAIAKLNSSLLLVMNFSSYNVTNWKSRKIVKTYTFQKIKTLQTSQGWKVTVLSSSNIILIGSNHIPLFLNVVVSRVKSVPSLHQTQTLDIQPISENEFVIVTPDDIRVMQLVQLQTGVHIL